MIDAGRNAALHILNTGKLPLLEFEVLARCTAAVAPTAN
jgi:hypothetical protein